jgi:hypothetical protein
MPHIVIFVAYVSSVLFHRGDVSDAMFLALFALSQLIMENPSAQLGARIFLPSLALSQLLLDSWAEKTHTDAPKKNIYSSGAKSETYAEPTDASSCASLSGSESAASTIKASGIRVSAGNDSPPPLVAQSYNAKHINARMKKDKNKVLSNEKEKEKSKRNGAGSGIPSARSSMDKAAASTTSGEDGSRSKRSGESSYSNSSGRHLPLHHRLLTLTAHLLLIRRSINDPTTGFSVDEPTELFTYAAMVIYIMCLPLIPGIGCGVLIAAHDITRYALENEISICQHIWQSLTFTRLFAEPFILQMKRYILDICGATACAEENLAVLYRLYACVVSWSKYLLLDSKLSIKVWGIAEALIRSHSSIYALIFLGEPVIARFFAAESGIKDKRNGDVSAAGKLSSSVASGNESQEAAEAEEEARRTQSSSASASKSKVQKD